MQDILEFWFPNNEYNNFWFDKSADNYIIDNFSEILIELQNTSSVTFIEWNKSIEGKVAIIIVLDQFTRSFYRNTRSIYMNDELAFSIAKEIISNNLDKQLPLNYRIFVLMPYRHQKKSIYLDIVMEKIKEYSEFGKSLLLEKFRLATIKNYTTMIDRINILTSSSNTINIMEYMDILDPNCMKYSKILTNKLNLSEKNLYNILGKYFSEKFNLIDRIIGVSLSGGVDSMVILMLLKMLEMNNIILKVYAFHLE